MIRRLYIRCLKELFALVVSVWTSPCEHELVRVGSPYGGWWLQPETFKPGASVVAVGAGEDITFDLEVARRFPVSVYIVDPTPRAIAHFEREIRLPENLGLASKIKFVKAALSDTAGRLKLYYPKDPTHVSLSILTDGRPGDVIEVDSITLADLKDEYNVRNCVYLKLDIEGAEIKVLRSLNLVLAPQQLGVEFDSIPISGTLASLFTALRTINQLRNAGYKIRKRDGWNLLLTK